MMILDRLYAAAERRTPLCFAHRGYSAAALENSAEAFRLARSAGADGVECDVQLTSDGTLIVFHDADLMRLAGHARRVEESSLAELRAIPLAAPTGVSATVATLDEMLQASGPAMLLDIEVKSYRRPLDEVAAHLVRWIASREVSERTIISSFDPRALLACRRAARRIAMSVVTAPIWCDDVEVPRVLRRGVARRAIGSSVAKPCARLVRRAAGARPPRLVWTVNEISEARRLCGLGVAGLIGDDPTVLQRGIEVSHP